MPMCRKCTLIAPAWRIRIDVLHSGRKPAQCVNRSRLFELVVFGWMRQHLQQSPQFKIDSLIDERPFMLYLDQVDHRFHDCMSLSAVDSQYSIAVQEYQCTGKRASVAVNHLTRLASVEKNLDSYLAESNGTCDSTADRSDVNDAGKIVAAGRSQDLHLPSMQVARDRFG